MIEVFVLIAVALLIGLAVAAGICTIAAAMHSSDVSQEIERQKEDLYP